MSSSSCGKSYSPIVINSPSTSSMDVNQLQEYIKKNPSVLEKKHITINKIYTDGSSRVSDDSDNELKESKKDKKKIANTTSSLIQNVESKEEYISKREIEIQKLDDTIRYLKLDLNNEQVKTSELEELLKKEIELRKSYEQTIQYMKDYVEFMKNEPFQFALNLKNITDYNTEIISSAKKYLDIEISYKNLVRPENNIVDSVIKSYHDKDIQQKFKEIKKSYENMNSSLVSIGKKFVFMKTIIYILLFVNLFLSMRNIF